MTNKIAIRLLFRPHKKVGFIQGVIPKNKNEIARKIAETIQKELINSEDIINYLEENNISENIKNQMDKTIQRRVLKRIPGFIPKKEKISKIIVKIINKDKEEIDKEIEILIKNNLEKSANIKELVYKKVSNFDIKKIENIIMNISKKEMNLIEVFGAIIGFIVGLLQLLIINFI